MLPKSPINCYELTAKLIRAWELFSVHSGKCWVEWYHPQYYFFHIGHHIAPYRIVCTNTSQIIYI